MASMAIQHRSASSMSVIWNRTEEEERLYRWRLSANRFALEAFGFVADKWQEQFFHALSSPDPIHMRISLEACAGPGKTAVLAIAIWYFLVCWGEKGEHPKGAGTSITHDNLKDNLWPEISKWQQRNEHMRKNFTWTKESVYANHHPETWFFRARSYSKTADVEAQGRTLSGLHSRYVMGVVDESGDVPVTVLKAGEQALSTGPVFGKLIQAGNPTSVDGMLWAAHYKLGWHCIRITGDPDDPNRSPRIDIDFARKQIAMYGRDDHWVMAYILGLFPPSSISSLIGPEEVEAAMKRHIREDVYSFSQKRLGMDVALEGDDRSTICPRQGLAWFKPKIIRSQKPEVLSAALLSAHQKWQSDLELVDNTGGFGSGVVSHLRIAGRNVYPIHFASQASEPKKFANIRAQMWWRMCEAIKNGAALPNEPDLVQELVKGSQYFLKNGKFQIIAKEQIKKELKRSPDIADGFACTFALPEMGRNPLNPGDPMERACKSEYDPHANT